jgi:hypothetical protein
VEGLKCCSTPVCMAVRARGTGMPDEVSLKVGNIAGVWRRGLSAFDFDPLWRYYVIIQCCMGSTSSVVTQKR